MMATRSVGVDYLILNVAPSSSSGGIPPFTLSKSGKDRPIISRLSVETCFSLVMSGLALSRV